MKCARLAAAVVALILITAPIVAAAAKGDEKAREQFEAILLGSRDSESGNELVKRAIDRKDLTQRVLAVQTIDLEVRKIFDDNFWELVGIMFLNAERKGTADAEGVITQFEFQDGKGHAIVRYAFPQHMYSFEFWEIRQNNGGRLKIVDRFDSNTGQAVTAALNEQLLTVMPNSAATRRLLSVAEPSSRQLFQVTEMLKAARDLEAPRFFEIYDDLGEQLQREVIISRLALRMAYIAKDADRLQHVFKIFVAVNGNNPDYAKVIANGYFALQNLSDSYIALIEFHEYFDMGEGAMPARLSALALALGKNEHAEKYAVEATTNEPSLELGWWSLLRARAQAENFAGSVEALAQLENNFGHTLDAANLRRDPFRGFIRLVESPEYEQWRASQ